MSKLNRKITLITNAVLVFIFTAVLLVGFLPWKSVPIYGGGDDVNAVYNGNRAHKRVSFMFNVYENTQVVNGIIDLLNEQGVKATFFVGGCWADDNGTTLCKMAVSGHEIGNHGYFHKDHKTISYQNNVEEIENTDKIVAGLSGVKMTLFAPPSGSFSETTLEVADKLGYKVIMWSKDTIDWRDKDQNVLYKRATSSPENGDLILMHPKEHTLKVLPSIIEYYKSIGFSIVTVSENLS